MSLSIEGDDHSRAEAHIFSTFMSIYLAIIGVQIPVGQGYFVYKNLTLLESRGL